MSLIDDLLKIKNIKESIKDALIDKGVDVSDSTFKDYPSLVNEMSGGGDCCILKLNILNGNNMSDFSSNCYVSFKVNDVSVSGLDFQAACIKGDTIQWTVRYKNASFILYTGEEVMNTSKTLNIVFGSGSVEIPENAQDLTIELLSGGNGRANKHGAPNSSSGSYCEKNFHQELNGQTIQLVSGSGQNYRNLKEDTTSYAKINGDNIFTSGSFGQADYYVYGSSIQVINTYYTYTVVHGYNCYSNGPYAFGIAGNLQSTTSGPGCAFLWYKYY